MSSERLDLSLLEELRALDMLRGRYQLEHPAAQLGPEDPDVRRMLEAMAYSLVRTRLTTRRNLQATWRRLLSSYFHFLLQPLPAMAIAKAVVTAGMTEATVLPRGTHLKLTTLDGFQGSFMTLAELRVVPAQLVGLEVVLRRDGFRLLLNMESQYERADDLGILRFHINYLDHYLAALRVHRNLELHLTRCSIVYDASVGAETEGIPCQAAFGSYFDEPYEADIENPLERARNFFHFPEGELFINIRVPPAQRAWRRFSIILDLDRDWPRDPPVYRELFHPFAVPIANLRRSMSQPIDCNGTQDTYPIRYLEDDYSFVLHRYYGVYQITPEGLARLHSAALSSVHPSFEVEEQSLLGAVGSYALIVRMPEAFLDPRRLVVDASWYQPEFARHAVGPIHVALWDRSVRGLQFQTVGLVRAALECPLRQDPDRLLHLLSLKMKPVLEKEELWELLSMFGSVEAGVYRELPQRIIDLNVEVVPDGRLQGAGIRHIYHVLMRPHEPEEAPLVALFLRQIGGLLDAWDYEARVELRAETQARSAALPLPSFQRDGTRGGAR